MIDARFGHVNLVARDWRLLADFYERVFGCVFVPPERDLSGPVLEAGTGVAGATIRGAHLRLPGLGDGGPTLEIFQYGSGPDRPPTAINRPGFGHIAFAVPDVATAREAVLAETRANRRAVALLREGLRELLPLDARSILRAVTRGQDPGGSGIVML